MIARIPFLLLAFSALVLGGCISNPSKDTSTPTSLTDLDALLPEEEGLAETPTTPPQLEQDDPDFWRQLVNGYELWHISHPRIDLKVREFRQRNESLTRQLRAGEPYLHYILGEVEKRGLPTELALLPGIESGFRPMARSRHGASGLWQFMAATGHYFGLKQDSWYDARLDTVASTDAALNYLQKLNKRFDGDWLLAIAAYNAGGGTVARAIRKNQEAGKPTDYWSLDLPRETQHYVPKLLALARIIGQHEKYGLVLPEISNMPTFVKVDIGKQLDIQVASELIGMEPRQLLQLNAGLKIGITHPDGPHYLLIPSEKAEEFDAKLKLLPDNQRLRWTQHRVQKGDTLSRLARKYGVSIAAIQQANGLRGSTIRLGSQLIIPLSGHSKALTTSSRQAQPNITKVHYQVRKGDSLYGIARQFRVKIDDLKRWNALPSDLLRPGQKLTVVRTL